MFFPHAHAVKRLCGEEDAVVEKVMIRDTTFLRISACLCPKLRGSPVYYVHSIQFDVVCTRSHMLTNFLQLAWKTPAQTRSQYAEC